MSAGKILVVRGGAIGDFVLTLPVFAALREQFPAAQIEVLGYPHIAGLARTGALVDEVRSIEARSLAPFFARSGILDQELQHYFGSFAIIISYLYDPDGIFHANVARCSKAQFIAGPHRPDERGSIPASEVFLRPLERLAIYGADTIPKLAVSPKEPREPDTFLLAVHPGSGSPQKNWPEEKWLELLRRVAALPKVRLLLVGGEAELDRLARLHRELPNERTELVQNLSLVDLGSRLANCDLFVGHDSGITHLAAAVGTSALALWGESNLQVWAPQGSKAKVIRHHRGLAELEVERVWEDVWACL